MWISGLERGNRMALLTEMYLRVGWMGDFFVQIIEDEVDKIFTCHQYTTEILLGT